MDSYLNFVVLFTNIVSTGVKIKCFLLAIGKGLLIKKSKRRKSLGTKPIGMLSFHVLIYVILKKSFLTENYQ